MSKIKTRDVVKGTIKAIDKTARMIERTKDAIVDIKEKSENAYNSDTNINEYTSRKVNNSIRKEITDGSIKFNIKGKNAVIETKENIIKTKTGIKNIKTKIKNRKINNKINKEIKTSKQTLNKAKKVATETAKNVRKGRIYAQNIREKTVRVVKGVFRATKKTVKAIIAGTNALIAAIFAGGWVAVMVIIVVSLIAILCNTVFGIFFSSEDIVNEMIMNTVVQEINNEMAIKIRNIQNSNIYDDYVITSDRAEWKEVLSIYSVKVYDESNSVDVITMNEEKKEILKDIFWDMNRVSYEIKNEVSEDNLNERVLYITISSKSVDEMINNYNLSNEEEKQMEELLSDEYSTVWSSVIFGTPLGSPSMVQIALSQVGNVGGQPYWSWYGFTERVDWCAIFVSWVANESGYLDTGVIPKFAVVSNGVNWFKAVGQWQDNNYIPREGDIIFFDWENDGGINHVGIVEKVEDNKVYTIEGNSNDSCKQKHYSINSNVIYGYGTPNY